MQKTLLNKNQMSKTIVFGLGLTLDKIYLFLLPYLLSETSYNSFNKSYYLAGIITLFGTFGFNFAIRVIRLSNKLIYLLIFINSLIVTLVLWLFFEGDAFPYLPFLFAFISSVFLIFQFEFIFQGEIKKYFITIILLFLSGIISLIISLAIQQDLFLILVLLNSITLFISSTLFLKGSLQTKKDITAAYISGASALMINGAGVAVLGFGKYIASQVFTIKLSNSFIFLSLLVTPILMSGNLVERFVYSIKREIKNRNKIITGLLLFIFILYSAAVILVMHTVPELFPASIDMEILRSLAIPILIGTAIYGAYHFPLNGILFKEAGITIQKKLAVYYLFFMCSFAFCVHLFLIADSPNAFLLIFFIYGSLFILTSIKYFLIFKKTDI